MLLRIHDLMKELNIPLGCDKEKASASWTDIETSMKGLLCLENMKSKQLEEKSKNVASPKGKSICLDLRATSPDRKNNLAEEEIEKLNYENSTPTEKFRTSLDRLTEHTGVFSKDLVRQTPTKEYSLEVTQ